MNSPETPSPTVTASSPFRRALSQPAFLVICTMLLLAAVTLNAATSAMRLHFKKEPVPQPQDFHELPQIMGPWMQVSEDEKLDKEIQDVLGTDKYVYRDYIKISERGADVLVYFWALEHLSGDKTADLDMSAVSQEAISKIHGQFDPAPISEQIKMVRDALHGKTTTELKRMVYALQRDDPQGVVNMGLTYYTGLVDTVAHIPDRCYIADGYEPSSYDIPTWDLSPKSDGSGPMMPVRFISFEDQTGNNRVPKCVAYVFHVNGHYEQDPLGVRQTLQSLTQRYGYYAKIELMTVRKGRDTTPASEDMRSFLSAARPEIEKCLPDWNKVTQAHS
jgi:hypothetical protein